MSEDAHQPEERVAPFYCGTQRLDWKCHNCDFCTKRYEDGAAAPWRCDLERLIDEAYMGDGMVSPAIALRMGTPDDPRVYNWRCPEFVQDVEERARVQALIESREREKRGRTGHGDWIEDWAKKKGIKLPR